MRRSPLFILIILIVVSLLGAGCTSPATLETGQQTTTVTPAAPMSPVVTKPTVTTADTLPGTVDNTSMPVLLTRIEGRVNRSVGLLDQNISAAAKSLGDTGISGGAADLILEDLAASPPVIDAVTVTNAGVIAAVMPARYQDVIGEPVGDQPHIMKGLSTGAPVLSDEFTTVEGFNASAVVYPVRSANGTVTGLLSVPFLPERLLSDAISPLIDGSVYEVTVIQADGRVIYATNASQVGMMSLSDPFVVSRPDLVLLINRVVSEDSGNGTYTIRDATTNTNKTVQNYWTTVSLHGTPWRINLDKIEG